MQQATTTSKQYTINWKDLLRGLLVAVITALISGIYEAVNQCGISCIDWPKTGGIALAAGLAYLIKNFFTPAEIVVQNPTVAQIDAVKAGEANVQVVNK